MRYVWFFQFLSDSNVIRQSVDTITVLSLVHMYFIFSNALSGQSFWLQIQMSRVRSPALPDFLSSSGFGTGSTQPREPREVN